MTCLKCNALVRNIKLIGEFLNVFSQPQILPGNKKNAHMDKIAVITVVRDYEMYTRLIKNNINFQSAVLYDLDNTAENKSISVRYNEFINAYDFSQETWFVFCHEDWELKEDIAHKLAFLDKNSLYGPIGTVLLDQKSRFLLRSLGGVKNSDKEGKNIRFYGRKCKDGTSVETFDCQCLIVHSGLIEKYGLRFDENLGFDLYVEDFCANAKEKFGIASRIVNLKCRHYSYGNIRERFYDSFEYLQDKYAAANYSYSNGLITKTFGKKLSLPIKRDTQGFINSLKRKMLFLGK